MKAKLDFKKGYWQKRDDLPPLWMPPLWRLTMEAPYLVFPMAAKTRGAGMPEDIDEKKENAYAKAHGPHMSDLKKYMHEWVDSLAVDSYKE